MAERNGAHPTAQGIRRYKPDVPKPGTLSERKVRERVASAGYEAIDLFDSQAGIGQSIPESSEAIAFGRTRQNVLPI